MLSIYAREKYIGLGVGIRMMIRVEPNEKRTIKQILDQFSVLRSKSFIIQLKRDESFNIYRNRNHTYKYISTCVCFLLVET
jgi:hypothetical protein